VSGKGIVEANRLTLELMLGVITFVDPEQGICKVQPLDTPIGYGKSVDAFAGSNGILALAGSRDTCIYQLYDHVLYVRTATESIHSADQLPAAIIICKAPHELQISSKTGQLMQFDVDDFGEIPTGDIYEYYTKIASVTDRGRRNNEVAAVRRSWLESMIGGDRLVEGRNTIFRVSDEVIQILGRRCGIHVNSVDSSVAIHGITHETRSVGSSARTAIVNDSIVHICETDDDIASSALTDTGKKARHTREAIESDLVYGRIDTVYSDKGLPLAQTQELNNGVRRISTINGLLLEKTEDITSYAPNLTASIQFDSKIKDRPKDSRKAFDRISDSSSWKKHTSHPTEKADYLRKPGDRSKTDGYTGITDANGLPIPTFKGTASFGFLPNGGFVIRDAWGSEIRMCDGDIQIAAARNIQYISGQDSLEVIGGVKAINACKGLEAIVRQGNVDINAAKEINMLGGTRLSASALEASILSTNNITLKSEAGSVITSGTNMHFTAENELTLSGAKVYAVGSAESALASPSAIVRCAGSLSIANNDIRLYGGVRLGKTAYSPGTLCGIKISCGVGSGYLQIHGSLSVDESISVNDSLQVKNTGAFGKLATADAQKVEGGYGFGGKLRQGPKAVAVNPPPAADTLSATTFDAAKKSTDAMNSKTLLAAMFSAAKNLKNRIVNLIKPKFSGVGANTVKINKAVSVDIGGETKYIYPGESFWKSSGLVSITNQNTADTLLDEQLSEKAAQGASELQLS
jgi:hypothetical protein